MQADPDRASAAAGGQGGYLGLAST